MSLQSHIAPMVSVIVPNYNHRRYLPLRLDSILAQTYTGPTEIIILDDCSSDDSLLLIHDYIHRHADANMRVIPNSSNSGSPFKQWKKGLETARGRYVWIAESDDWADREFLQTMMTMIQAEGLDLCFCRSYLADENDKVTGLYPEPAALAGGRVFDYSDIRGVLAGECLVPNASSAVFDRELALRHIDKSLGYRQSGDWVMWAMIMRYGRRYGYTSQPLNYFRRHSMSTCVMGARAHRNVEEAYRVLPILQAQGIPCSTRYWVRVWLRQSGYSMRRVLRSNFMPIARNLTAWSLPGLLWLPIEYMTPRVHRLLQILRLRADDNKSADDNKDEGHGA